jgi:TPR repeat protein
MPAERPKLSATRISSRVVALALTLGALVAGPVLATGPVNGQARNTISFVSPELALEQGLGAFRSGNLEIALPALEAASTTDGRTGFIGQFYLARIFSDNSHPATDHGRAYMLFQRLADENADIDPDDDLRAPFVAKSLMALSAYLRRGVTEIGLQPNPARAAQYMHHAATVFSDEDAQFELAKLFLTGEGVENDVRRAIHWFSVLSQRGHTGAQAFLADLQWRGKHVPKDPRRALALITLALENAPAAERIWIEDIYQNIFCGTSEGTRNEASGYVADWRTKYGRALAPSPHSGLAILGPQAARTCSDGRPVNVEALRQLDHATGSTGDLLEINGRPRGQ